ncbi:hypothetical protein [Coleofasciculus chthonoplastes]|uniref:hypothetical protein n=1 Tax=Coleofasciculus chthonoplastes TaxID=64178 RepID=UPI0012F9F968|nr:hypothetical protein [Coleofasciculus chthonoplastes]
MARLYNCAERPNRCVYCYKLGDQSQIGQRNPPCPQSQDYDGDNRARHCRAPTTTEGIIDWVGARYRRALPDRARSV